MSAQPIPTPKIRALIEAWRAERAAIDEFDAAERSIIRWKSEPHSRYDADGLRTECPTTSEEQRALDTAIDAFEMATREAMPELLALFGMQS